MAFRMLDEEMERTDYEGMRVKGQVRERRPKEASPGDGEQTNNAHGAGPTYKDRFKQFANFPTSKRQLFRLRGSTHFDSNNDIY